LPFLSFTVFTVVFENLASFFPMYLRPDTVFVIKYTNPTQSSGSDSTNVDSNSHDIQHIIMIQLGLTKIMLYQHQCCN
jgi:hypothetical protein